LARLQQAKVLVYLESENKMWRGKNNYHRIGSGKLVRTRLDFKGFDNPGLSGWELTEKNGGTDVNGLWILIWEVILLDISRIIHG
jgi:hypothetical protein